MDGRTVGEIPKSHQFLKSPMDIICYGYKLATVKELYDWSREARTALAPTSPTFTSTVPAPTLASTITTPSKSIHKNKSSRNEDVDEVAFHPIEAIYSYMYIFVSICYYMFR
jgi:hypothetical protein